MQLLGSDREETVSGWRKIQNDHFNLLLSRRL